MEARGGRRLTQPIPIKTGGRKLLLRGKKGMAHEDLDIFAHLNANLRVVLNDSLKREILIYATSCLGEGTDWCWLAVCWDVWKRKTSRNGTLRLPYASQSYSVLLRSYSPKWTYKKRPAWYSDFHTRMWYWSVFVSFGNTFLEAWRKPINPTPRRPPGS